MRSSVGSLLLIALFVAGTAAQAPQSTARNDLPAGRYSFYVTHRAYLEQSFDQPRPLARYRLLELAEGEQLDGVVFSLHRGGVNWLKARASR
jgi:hypothetical protein